MENSPERHQAGYDIRIASSEFLRGDEESLRQLEESYEQGINLSPHISRENALHIRLEIIKELEQRASEPREEAKNIGYYRQQYCLICEKLESL